ncbi:DUF6916 family protein [Dyadobacter sp. LHD-138]|uniref:DUF6916 family protein n=1 Tax=Dyadobacter sp. LHD-138 TaxID=3071413 RepID=UPI0027E020E8|nr:hypothetical protein [Dyadobacter sp. LHD-138]MDQ6481322.1 hypothetical protein [Dyadobacter sp. LHD-138]
METYDLSKITAADFSEYLDQTMDIHFSETGAVAASVVKVTDLDNYSPLERGAFSVVLQTIGDNAHHPQGIYVIEHPENKKLEVFLVPIGPGQNGMKYEAVFS